MDLRLTPEEIENEALEVYASFAKPRSFDYVKAGADAATQKILSKLTDGELEEKIANEFEFAWSSRDTMKDAVKAIFPLIVARREQSRKEEREATAREIISLLQEWDKEGLPAVTSPEAIIAASRGHLWPYIQVLESKFGV